VPARAAPSCRFRRPLDHSRAARSGACVGEWIAARSTSNSWEVQAALEVFRGTCGESIRAWTCFDQSASLTSCKQEAHCARRAGGGRSKSSWTTRQHFAVAVAFYAVFSVFRCCCCFVTILGYVLAGDRSLLDSVRDSVLGNFPVIGSRSSVTAEGSAWHWWPACVVAVVESQRDGKSDQRVRHVWDIPAT